MGFISRLRKVTGKAAEEQEARIKARDAAGLKDVEALLDAELDESPELRKAKAKVRALQAQGNGGDDGSQA
jgi:hypothetical protein